MLDSDGGRSTTECELQNQSTKSPKSRASSAHITGGKALSRRELELIALFCLCHTAIGYSMGAISPVMESVSGYFALDSSGRGLLGASALAGNLLGSPVGGMVADFYGRRKCLLVAWTVFVAACIGQASAVNATSLCIARASLGFAVGAHYTGTTAYLSESLQPQHVGTLLSFLEACFFFGSFLSITVGAGLRFVFDPSDSIYWRLILSLCGLPVAVGLGWCYLRAPETHVWMCTRKQVNQETQTDDSFAIPMDALSVISNPSANSQPSSSQRSSLLSAASSICFVSIFWGTLIVPTYAISAFAVTILSALDLNTDPFLLNMLMGATAAGGVFLGMGLIDKLGRKNLLLVSQWGVAVSFFCLGFLKTNASVLIALFLLFELFNGAGAPLALVYPAEIFEPRIKGVASGISAMNSRIMAVMAILVMSYGLAAIGAAYTIALIGLLSALGAIATHFMAPPERIA